MQIFKRFLEERNKSENLEEMSFDIQSGIYGRRIRVLADKVNFRRVTGEECLNK